MVQEVVVANGSSAAMFANNVVAQSDHTAALQAMEATFRNAIDEETDLATRTLFQAAQASLVQNLNGLIQPLEDDDYHGLVDPYHVVADDDDDDDDESDFDYDYKSDEEEEQQVDDEDFDEEDLLDTKALQEAQQLRSQVRSMSQRVQQIRERVLEQSSKERTTTTVDLDVRVRVDAPEMDEDTLASLTTSLASLSLLLQNSQWSQLPKQLENLQDTIDVVQKESSKDPRTMSQTEVAIVSRNNSSDENEDNLHTLSQEDKDLSAPDRLVRFFQEFE
jgi:hypothetical protein